MNEKVRTKLLKIFAGGKSINEVYERKNGELVPLVSKTPTGLREDEKEEMQKLKEELSQTVNN